MTASSAVPRIRTTTGTQKCRSVRIDRKSVGFKCATSSGDSCYAASGLRALGLLTGGKDDACDCAAGPQNRDSGNERPVAPGRRGCRRRPGRPGRAGPVGARARRGRQATAQAGLLDGADLDYQRCARHRLRRAVRDAFDLNPIAGLRRQFRGVSPHFHDLAGGLIEHDQLAGLAQQATGYLEGILRPSLDRKSVV